jgi:hypothetical protein
MLAKDPGALGTAREVADSFMSCPRPARSVGGCAEISNGVHHTANEKGRRRPDAGNIDQR